MLKYANMMIALNEFILCFGTLTIYFLFIVALFVKHRVDKDQLIRATGTEGQTTTQTNQTSSDKKQKKIELAVSRQTKRMKQLVI